MRKGPAVTDDSAGDSAPLPDNGATTKMPRPTADDFEPDVPVDAACRAWRGGRRRAGGSGNDAGQHGVPADIGQAARRLRRRPHPRRAAVRHPPRTGDRGRHVRRGRAPHPRRHYRRRPIPAACLPRRTTQPAVLAGVGYRAGSAGRAHLRRSGSRPVRRGPAADPRPYAAAEPGREPRHRPHPRCREHGVGRPCRERVDPRRVTGGGGRDLAVPDRRRPSDADPRRGRRTGAPVGCRVVDRSSQPGPGQHRGRCGAGIPRDHAGGHARGRHPRHRGGAVRAARQPLAAGGGRRPQRVGACRGRRGGRAGRARAPSTAKSRSRSRPRPRGRCRRAAASAPHPRC